MSLRFVVRIVVLALSVGGYALAADPPGPPWTQEVSPASITLRWYPDELGEAPAQRIAAAHCATSGRTAALDAIELDGSVEIGRYNCR